MDKGLLKSVAGSVLALSFLGGAAFAQGAENATVAFLMPDQASTRYEERDYPGFQAEMQVACIRAAVLTVSPHRSKRIRRCPITPPTTGPLANPILTSRSTPACARPSERGSPRAGRLFRRPPRPARGSSLTARAMAATLTRPSCPVEQTFCARSWAERPSSLTGCGAWPATCCWPSSTRI